MADWWDLQWRPMYGAMLKTLLEGARSTYMGKLKARWSYMDISNHRLAGWLLGFNGTQQIRTTPKQIWSSSSTGLSTSRAKIYIICPSHVLGSCQEWPSWQVKPQVLTNPKVIEIKRLLVWFSLFWLQCMCCSTPVWGTVVAQSLWSRFGDGVAEFAEQVKSSGTSVRMVAEATWSSIIALSDCSTGTASWGALYF